MHKCLQDLYVLRLSCIVLSPEYVITYLQVAELEQLRREESDRFQRSYEVGMLHSTHV